MKLPDWLKNLFHREAKVAVEAAADHTAQILADHPLVLADAQRLVQEAETRYAAETKAGPKKWAMVMSLLASGWQAVEPYVLQLLAAVAVSMLKEAIAKKSEPSAPT
jgi:hypothetical protein